MKEPGHTAGLFTDAIAAPLLLNFALILVRDLAADLAAGELRRMHVGIRVSRTKRADELRERRRTLKALAYRTDHVGRDDDARHLSRWRAGRLSTAPAGRSASDRAPRLEHVRLAHVRERTAPAGAPWRLAGRLDDDRWLDFEPARSRLLARDARLAHNEPLFRAPVTTLDAHLAAGRRVEALRALLDPYLERPELLGDEDDDSYPGLAERTVRFGPPVLQPASLRDFYAFEAHVRTAWERRSQPVPEAWYRIPVFYFSNVSEIRGPGDPVWPPAGSKELDYELEVGALVDTEARNLPPDRAEDAIGGYFIVNDWSARDLQREETAVRLGPAKGKDFATSIGPWLVTPDELRDTRDGKGYALAMTASVNGVETSRGSWSDIHYSFGDMLARASRDARLRRGDVVGSGTVGTGCLLEVGGSRLGRYLVPGDEVVLTVERLGELQTSIVEPPE
jgi:fumarylacetoacetate (FAA) hydrolase